MCIVDLSSSLGGSAGWGKGQNSLAEVEWSPGRMQGESDMQLLYLLFVGFVFRDSVLLCIVVILLSLPLRAQILGLCHHGHQDECL